MNEFLSGLRENLTHLIPEFTLAGGVVLLILAGSFKKKIHAHFFPAFTAAVALATSVLVMTDGIHVITFFPGMLVIDGVASYLKILLNAGTLLTCVMALRNDTVQKNSAEFHALLLTIVLGGHFLLMSTNLLMTFISLELVSLCSYMLSGFAFNRRGSEGSLKYFLFGAVASAVMLYGFSILYGLTGSLQFTSEGFIQALFEKESRLVLLSGGLALTGFIFKVGAIPFHAWAPDVYEGAPIPVVAFISTVPKLAGLGALSKFILAMNVYGQSAIDWQVIICLVAIITITAGNVAALSQGNGKRMMAWSSIAQSGFLLVGLGAFSAEGMHFMLFYASTYLLMNFLVFIYLEIYEKRGITELAGFSAIGRNEPLPVAAITIGLLALTGLPPTAGFTGKLFLFTANWQAYETTHKPVLLVLLIVGLLNTVVSLFYYLKIPYYAFLKDSRAQATPKSFLPLSKPQNFTGIENLLGLILVLLVLVLFFIPGLLMGWINKVNFAF
jgi:NADH-quinone oxidoreductase subunit N